MVYFEAGGVGHRIHTGTGAKYECCVYIYTHPYTCTYTYD